jgi:hypothetical protein
MQTTHCKRLFSFFLPIISNIEINDDFLIDFFHVRLPILSHTLMLFFLKQNYLNAAEHYIQETELSKRVQEWNEKLAPLLHEQVIKSFSLSLSLSLSILILYCGAFIVFV